MTEYIIISPTADRAMYYWGYTLDRLGGMVRKKSRPRHTIETRDVKLRFISESQSLFVRTGTKATVLTEGYFVKKLDEFITGAQTVIHIGDEVRFDAFKGIRPVGFKNHGSDVVIGKVVYINQEHRWFEAEYPLGDTKQRISFKFEDIDDQYNTVTIVKKKQKKEKRNGRYQ